MYCNVITVIKVGHRDTCSWFSLSPAEGIGVRVGLFLFLVSSPTLRAAAPLKDTPVLCAVGSQHLFLAIYSLLLLIV